MTLLELDRALGLSRYCGYMQTKRCCRCKETKPVSEFSKRNRDGHLLQSRCKVCMKELHYAWTQANPGRHAEIKAQSHARMKARVLEHYGSRCSCCGEDNPGFLCVDHVNDDGADHRRMIGRGSDAIFRWLIKSGFPEGFRVLCFNCNAGRHYNGGVCPHEEVMPNVLAGA